jgi:hypothetical protein
MDASIPAIETLLLSGGAALADPARVRRNGKIARIEEIGAAPICRRC